MEVFANPDAWVALLTLTFLEIVLGIDNIIFISIVTGKLPEEKRKKATRIGLFLAMFMRIALLFGITLLIAMKAPWFSLDFGWFKGSFTGQAMVLFFGGLFLIYKSTIEIFELLEHAGETNSNKVVPTFWNVVFMVILIDIVFSFDSIITAVGLAQHLPVMVLAVIFSMIIMLFFSGAISKFINAHPSVKLLALAFLLVIGIMLLVEGWSHDIAEHLNLKGYVYFGMAFSVLVELLNMKMRKKDKKDEPVELKDIYK
jgi:predicted tellurium resistance membrane protein TerC